MSYKKYIKRGGRLYGPYIYKSKRDGSRIITEYVGKGKVTTGNKSRLFLFLMPIILLAIILFLLVKLPIHPSSRVVLEPSPVYNINETITGDLKIKIRHGELIPADSIVSFELNKQKKDLLISELVDINQTEGSFYAEDSELTGQGLGYGFIGENRNYPVIYFKLLISQAGESEENLSQEENIMPTSIDGEVSYGKDFGYDLQEGETAEIIPDSVKNGENLGSDILDLKIDNNKAVVSTGYYQFGYGFGQDYLTDDIEILSVNLGKMNFKAEKGNLDISISYNDILIAESSKPVILAEEIAEEVGNLTLNLTNKGLIQQAENIPDIYITKNSQAELDLSKYFSSSSDLSYSSVQPDNISITIENNIAIITPDKGFTGTRAGRMIITSEDSGIESNLFNIIVSEQNINIETRQYKAVVGKPVKWKKTIQLENPENLTIQLPIEAENIVVKKVENNAPKNASSVSNTNLVTGEVSLEISLSREPSLLRFFKNLWASITGRAVIEDNNILVQQEKTENVTGVVIHDNSTYYEIEYETPAPEAYEENLSRGKNIIITNPSNIHYQDITAFTELPRQVYPGSAKLYHIIDKEEAEVEIDEYDLDNNGLIDYIEWNVPYLSNQTYKLVIEIIKAEHLSSNRTFISDIYEQVYQLDSIWSEEINNNEYVRVTFEIPLDSKRDITLYPRIISGNPKIEVYEFNSEELIAEFENLAENEYNKVFLTDLQETQDTFDLRVIDGSLEINHIIDPIGTCDCNEGEDCVIDTGCELSNANCTGDVCDFNSLVVNAQLFPGHDGNSSRNLTLIITNNFNITSLGLINATGQPSSGNGGHGGYINITSANAYIDGSILTSGGNSTSSGNGGTGGAVDIITGYFNSTANIHSSGGSVLGLGGNGGSGGNITIYSSYFSANYIYAYGGNSIGGASAGGTGGFILINSTSNITIANINSHGGASTGTYGKDGGTIILKANNFLNISSIASYGGSGDSEGGDGGIINITTDTAVLGNINNSGGGGGSSGGGGGSINITSVSSITGANISSYGGGTSGFGGIINIFGENIIFTNIDTYGGASGSGAGGAGGNIIINSTGNISIFRIRAYGGTSGGDDGVKGGNVSILAHAGLINITSGVYTYGSLGNVGGQGSHQLFESYNLSVAGIFNASGGEGVLHVGGNGGNITQYYCSVFINSSAVYDVKGGTSAEDSSTDGFITAGTGSWCVPADITAPTFSDINTNQTYGVAGQSINFSANATDDYNISSVWFTSNFDIANIENQTQKAYENSNYAFGSSTQRGQQFRFSQNVYAYQACFRLQYNTGTKQNVTVALYSTVSGYPSVQLTNLTIDKDDITSLTAFCRNFTSPAYLTANTLYSLVFISPGSSSTSTYRVRGQSSGNRYASGMLITSTNSGTSWSSSASADLNFSILGSNFIWTNETLITVNSISANVSKVKQLLWASDTAFNYKWCANDSSGNINCSSLQDYYVYQDSPADTTYPEGSILSPPNGTRVNGNVTLDGTASDDLAVSYASIQYSNATVAWTNITGCERLIAPYDCNWNTALFSNDTSGYNIKIVPCDSSGNCNTTTIPSHYVIDKIAPILDFYLVDYPSGQSCIRDAQTLIFRINITDGSGAGINNTAVFADLLNLNSTRNTSMNLEAGDAATGQYSYWNISAELLGSSTGLHYNDYYAYDNATPTNNLMWNNFPVQIDNINPGFDSTTLGNSPNISIYNNTNVTFQVQVSDNFNLTGAIFSNNFSGSWVNNTVNFTGISAWAANVSRVYTGNYSYYFIIYDGAGNSNTTEKRSIGILGDEPVALNVSLTEPGDGDNLVESNVTFTYNYTGGTASTCNLYIDDLLNSSSISPAADTDLTFQLNFSAGNYDWFVRCNNSDGYDYDSEVRNLNISILDIEYPLFYNYTDNTNSLTETGTATFSANINSTNGTAGIEFNYTNYSAFNSTDNLFNITVSIVNSGLYPYYWWSYGNGSSNLFNKSAARSYTVLADIIKPNVIIVYPANNTAYNYTVTAINYTVSDNIGLSGCWYNTGNETNSSIAAAGVNFTSIVSSQGNNTWLVYCNDSSGNENVTAVTFSVDSIIPIITIISPANTTYNYTTLDFNVSLNENGSSCQYRLDTTLPAAWQTMTKYNDTYFNFTKTGLTDNSHYISFRCNDTMGNLNSSSGTLYFTIDTTPPSLTINSPTNTTYANGDNIVINITNSSDAQAVWWYNGTENLTYTGVISYNFTNGSMIVYAFANDSIGNLNITNVSFYVTTAAGTPSPPACGDGTCNGAETCSSCVIDCGACPTTPSSSCFPAGTRILMADGDERNIEDVKIGDEVMSYNFKTGEKDKAKVLELESPIRTGIYEINNLINATDEHPFYTLKKSGIIGWSSIDAEKGKADLIDSELEGQPVYNLEVGDSLYNSDGNWIKIKSITYYPITLKTYNLKTVDKYNLFYANNFLVHNKDGGPTICTNLCTLGAKRCLGDVSQLCEMSVSGCLIWVNQENCSSLGNYSCLDGICYSGNCTENWQCEWDVCNNEGYSNPINCHDLNNCKTNFNYPEPRKCSCIPKWVNCTGLSECQAYYTFDDILAGNTNFDGSQFKYCDDEKNCYNRTLINQACSLAITIEAKKVKWCEEYYVEIYNKLTGSLVSRVKETQVSDIKKIDIGFVVSNFTGYCAYCYNGIQDYDETGVDCGGNCLDCLEMPMRFDYWLWLVILLWILLFILILIYIYVRREEKQSKKEKLKNKIEELGKKK